MKSAVIFSAMTLVSDRLLGGMHQVARKPTVQATAAANNKAYKAVFNEVGTLESDDAPTIVIESRNADLAGMDFGSMAVENMLKAVDSSGNEFGYVITPLSNDSYDGIVRLSVGLKEDGIITGIEFLEVNDTPGLGLKVKEPAFKDRFTGESAQSLSVIKLSNADDTQINAISGATVTSSATTSTVNATLYYLRSCVNG